jgi:peptidoglycan hydrolase CwlO-like protein
MLRRKTKELEAEKIQGLELELKAKDKEIKSLKKQIGELKAENEHYKKTVRSTCNSTHIVMPLDYLVHSRNLKNMLG